MFCCHFRGLLGFGGCLGRKSLGPGFRLFLGPLLCSQPAFWGTRAQG